MPDDSRTIRVTIPYAPRPLQQELHDTLHRFNVLVAHRRFGKTVLTINELLKQAILCPKEAPRFAYVAPLFKQAKAVAWDYLKRFSAPIPGVQTNEAELRVDLPNDARIQLLGADNPDGIRGIYLDGVVLDEYAQMRPQVWPEIIRPALTDREGWAIFIGTPQGRNAFWQLYDDAQNGFYPDADRKGPRTKDPDWLAALYRASETKILSGEELAKAARTMTADQYAQEFECSFDAAILGAYYGRIIADAEREKRICRVPWDPAVKVTTAWDLGIGDPTAIWFAQFVGQEIHLIDFIENSGVGLSWYAGEIADRRAKGWVFGDHLLPHDAEARELGTGRTRTDTLRSLGIVGKVLPAASVDDGISQVRMLLPRCWIDAEKCAPGIEAVRQYRAEYDEKRLTLKQQPLHDWTSHAADALRYLAMGIRKDSYERKKREDSGVSWQARI